MKKRSARQRCGMTPCQHHVPAVVTCALWLFATASRSAWSVPVYSNDFESPVGTEWSNGTRNDSFPGAFTTFLGRFSDGGSTLSLTGVEAGTEYTLAFDLYAIDAWAGGVLPNGNRFRVTVGESVVFEQTISQIGSVQSMKPTPDTRGSLGFGPSVDSIFRRLELNFIPAAAGAEIRFEGAGLGHIDNRSWGIDNLAVYRSSDRPPTVVTATSLPPMDRPSATALDRFELTFLRPLDPGSATQTDHYELRHAGRNGVLGDGDDLPWLVTGSYVEGTKTVVFGIPSGPLPPGWSRLRILPGLTDATGAAVSPFQWIFRLADPVLGRIENGDNGILPFATELPLTESPSGSTFLTGLGLGTLTVPDDLDYWSFQARAGDRVTLVLEASDQPLVYPALELRNAADAVVSTATGDAAAGVVRIQDHPIPTAGTYYLRVSRQRLTSSYRLRVDLSRGVGLETEPNDDQVAANRLAFSTLEGMRSARSAGALDARGGGTDVFGLGWLRAGTSLGISLATPEGSTLDPDAIRTVLEFEGGAEPVAIGASAAFLLPVPSDGVHFLRLSGAGTDIRRQYVLTVRILDEERPSVWTVSLPADGASSSGLIDRFTARFTEELEPRTVMDPAHYELMAAGPGGTFDEVGVARYSVVPEEYSGGLTASYRILDGPLQPGRYRLRIGLGLVDLSGQPLAAEYLRTFKIAGVPPFVGENRSNGTPGRGTPLSRTGGEPNGRYYLADKIGPPGQFRPRALVSSDLNADGILDLAASDYGDGFVVVFLGNGNGTFTEPVKVGTGTGPIDLAAVDLNHDGHLDLAVANFLDNTVGTLLGDGTGHFTLELRHAVVAGPRRIQPADLDGDAVPELLLTYENHGLLTVLRRGGDGSYSATDHSTPDGVSGVACADLTGDGRPEVVVGTRWSERGWVFLNDGSGGLIRGTSFEMTSTPGFAPSDLAAGDLNRDGRADLVAAESRSGSLRILLGRGDGTFESARTVPGMPAPASRILLHDLSGDGWPDVVVAIPDADAIAGLVNRGDGTFGPILRLATTDLYSRGVALAGGDWNRDGLEDLASASQYGNNVALWMGDREEGLPGVLPGVTSAAGRGFLSDHRDEDYWTFSGRAGDQASIAVETEGNLFGSGLRYRLLDASGHLVGELWANSGHGWGQFVPLTLPQTGRYFVLVSRNLDYFGEYRLRVSLIRGEIDVERESEGNDAPDTADVPTLAGPPGRKVAEVYGYLGIGDTSGDYSRLGHLVPGASIALGLRLPDASGARAVLELHRRKDGVDSKVLESAPGETSLEYVVPVGEAGVYFARVLPAADAGLLAEYLLDIEIRDALPLSVIAVDLPPEGTVTTGIIDRLTISFDKELPPSAATNAAHFELRSSENDVFGDGDDAVYTLASEGYTKGLEARFLIRDGPLQPGNYRFTVRAGLPDAHGNLLATPYIRRFTVTHEVGYTLESRQNDAPQEATLLGRRSGQDGSFRLHASFGVGQQGDAGRPQDLAGADWNGDGRLDLAVANSSGNGVSILLGNGDGTFQRPRHFEAQAWPISLAVGDLDRDGIRDIAVANYYSQSVSILAGNGDGTFAPPISIQVGLLPVRVRLADLDGDGGPEILVTSESTGLLTVLTRVAGGTYSRLDYQAGAQLTGLAAADFDGDGRPDVATADAGNDTLRVFLNRVNASPSLTKGTTLFVESGPVDLAAGDIDGDGRIDLVALSATARSISVFRGRGDGTFQPAEIQPGLGYRPAAVRLADLDSDGRLDLAVAAGGAGNLEVRLNRGDGTFGQARVYSQGGGMAGVAVGDWNGDGLVDLATANDAQFKCSIWLGNPALGLVEDPPGVFTGLGRGRITDARDVDSWGFSGRRGDLLGVAVEIPGFPADGRLRFRVSSPDGATLAEFVPENGSGWGQSPIVALPVDGLYILGVHPHAAWHEEYRVRVTLVRNGIQMENEIGDNDSAATADLPEFASNAGVLTAVVHGYLGAGDVAGDYFRLGRLNPGTILTLGLRAPASSPANPSVELWRGETGALVKVGESSGAPPGLTATVGDGEGGPYYARVHGVSGLGLQAQYLLDLSVADHQAPTVVSLSLPAEGDGTSALVDQFAVRFSKEMSPSAVASPSSYELRGSGNAVFGDPDDEVLSLGCQNDASRTSAACRILGGPLLPGTYRLTLRTSLLDSAGNPLATDYVRTFSVRALEGFVTESRNNDTLPTSTPLGGPVGPGDYGARRFAGSRTVGEAPGELVTADFNADGIADLAVANRQSDSVSVLLGTGTGTFGEAIGVPALRGTALVAGDVDADGTVDLVLGGGSPRVLRGRGDGTFEPAVDLDPGASGLVDVELADLDRDGVPEILASYGGLNRLQLFRRVPAGGYAATESRLEGSADGLGQGDFNGDGFPDVVVTSSTMDAVIVLWGDSEGGLDASRSLRIPVGSQPEAVAVGDLNLDGWLDLAVLDSGSRDVAIVRGTGAGGFGTAEIHAGLSGLPSAIALADLQGDGAPDVLTASPSPGRLEILLNAGRGTPKSPESFEFGAASGLVVGDWNGDGIEDLATSVEDASQVTIWLGNAYKPLQEVGPGVLVGRGRGNLSAWGDSDAWRFSGRSGDLVSVAIQTLGPAPSLVNAPNLTIVSSSGMGLAMTEPVLGGWFESKPVRLTSDGEYFVAISPGYGTPPFTVEYRFRLVVLRNGVLAEVEPNNDATQANPLSYRFGEGVAQASIAGSCNPTDMAAGDWLALGNAAEGSTLRIAWRPLRDSSFVPELTIHDAAGNRVQSSAFAGEPEVAFTVPSGKDGAYYARVRPTFPSPKAGRMERVVAFRGVYASVEVPFDIRENGATVAFWFHSAFRDAGLFQVSSGPRAERGHDRHVYLQGGNLRAVMHNREEIGSTGLDLADGRWHHVTYAYGDAIGGERLYADGVRCAAGSKATSDFNWDDHIEFGRTLGVSLLWGAIVEAGVWNRVLTEEEIASLPGLSPLASPDGLAGYWPMTDGTGTTVRDASGSGRPGTLSSGLNWESTAPQPAQVSGVLASYLLEVFITDTIPPRVTLPGLPAEGSVVDAVIDRFKLGFNEDMRPASVSDPTALQLIGAGVDGSFGTADDLARPLASQGYVSGFEAEYVMRDGPLPPGNYQLTITTRLADRSGLHLVAPVVRRFAVAARPGFVMEAPGNEPFQGGASLSPAPSTAFGGSFARGPSFRVGSGPHMLRAGDLHGDGKPDLVTANHGDGTLSVLRGNGDGTFAGAATYPMGGQPNDLLLVDLDLDGALDVVAADFDPGGVALRFGVGDGTFGNLHMLEAGLNPNGLAVGDLDRDGIPDLAVGNRGSGDVSILLGTGGRNFGQARHFASGVGASRLAAVDLNHDGILDLAVANLTAGTVSVLTGDGTGRFSEPVSAPAGAGPYWVQVGHLDGNRLPDLVVPRINEPGLALFPGMPAMPLAPRVDLITSGMMGYHVETADLNADGFHDLLVSSFLGRSVVGVLMNRGDGTFRDAAAYATEAGALATVVGDWNLDGRPDFATACFYADLVSIHLGSGSLPVPTEPGMQGVRVVSGYGNLTDRSDVDYFQFGARAGDRLVLYADVPERASDRILFYQVIAAHDQVLAEFRGDFLGSGQSTPVELPWDGNYAVRVSAYFGYSGEYRFRVLIGPPGSAPEIEGRPGQSNLTPLEFRQSGSVKHAMGLGLVASPGDKDFFDLGTVEHGQTVVVRARPFSDANFTPTVTVRDAAGGYVPETPLERPYDRDADVVIPQTGRYHVAVSAGTGEGGLREGYVLEVRLQPTPNQAPTELALIPASQEDQTARPGSVGNLMASDPDPGETFVYALVPGAGSTGNANFTIRGDVLQHATFPTSTDPATKTVRVRATDQGGLSVERALEIAGPPTRRPRVVGRHVFYRLSAWDLAGDDGAIAPDKVALLPGAKAGFANYTSYSRGLNGIMVDIQALPGQPTPQDFEFRAGLGGDPCQWPLAPAPTSVTVRPGAGTEGSDRVTLVWAGNAVKRKWLQIRVRASSATGLPADDVFYFGNAVGESGNRAGNDALVNASDEILIRLNQRSALNPAPITSPYDFNRDKRVNAEDQLLARWNTTSAFTALPLTTPSDCSAAGGTPMGPETTSGSPRNDPARDASRLTNGGHARIRLDVERLAHGWLRFRTDDAPSLNLDLETRSETGAWIKADARRRVEPGLGTYWELAPQRLVGRGLFRVVGSPRTTYSPLPSDENVSE